MNLQPANRNIAIVVGSLVALAMLVASAFHISRIVDQENESVALEAYEKLYEVSRGEDISESGIENVWLVNAEDAFIVASDNTGIEPPVLTAATETFQAGEATERSYRQDETDYLLVSARYDDVRAVVAAVDKSAFVTPVSTLWRNALLLSLFGGLVGGLIGHFVANRFLSPARQAIENQRDFVADAAHEMRTPLAVITASASQTLSRDREGPEYRAALEEVRTAAARATEGVGELLELARLDSGAAHPRVSPLRLDLLAEEVASSVIVESVSVTSVLPQQPVVIDADYLLLRQAVENIVRNSAARGSDVVIEVSSKDTMGVIAVRDNGAGFDPDTLPSVFERFRRGDTKGRAGLGLAIARSIVDLHDGTIEASNHPDGGAMVTITIARSR